MKQRISVRLLLWRLYVLSMFALLIIAAQGLVDGEVRRIVISLGALLLVLRTSGVGIVALAASLLFGEWATATAVGLAIVSERLDLSLFLTSTNRLAGALAQAVGELPDALVERLRARAGPLPLTTWHAVDLALAENPEAWQPLLGADPGRDCFDGPLLDATGGAPYSQFFAEAAAFGTEIARVTGREVDADLLAAAASVVAASLAAEWVRGSLSETILQISPAQLRESFGAFYRRPAAAGFIVRVERELALATGMAERMSREQRARLTRRDVLLAQVVYRGTFVFAVGALLWDGVRAVARWRPKRSQPGRSVLTGRAAPGLVKSGAFGRWEEQTGSIDFSGESRRLVVGESAGLALLRLGCVLVAAAASAIIVGEVPWGPAGHGVLTLLPATVGALAIIVPGSRARPNLILSAFAAGAVWLLLGDHAVMVIVISAAGAIIAWLLRHSFERRALEGSAEEAWPSPPKSSGAALEMWLAAEDAALASSVPLATQMLDELMQREAPNRPELVEEANARIALWLLEDGRVGDAAARLDLIVPRSGESNRSELSASGNYAVGMLSSHLGDDLTATDCLTAALEQASGKPSLAWRIALSLAELHARLGNAEGALQTLEAHPLPRIGSSGMAMVIDREVVAASALERSGDPASALERIKQITRVDFSAETELFSSGRPLAKRISRAEGRANLLGGRLLLDTEQPGAAGPLLEKAARLLSHDTDAYLRATAQILYGHALALERQHDKAVQTVSEGLRTLEECRGQLSSGERRTAVVVAGEDIYEHALETFARAAHAGHGDAGVQGFALIESLRRSTISGMLRSPREEFRKEVNELVHDLDGASSDLSEPVRVQSLLSDLISKEAASAFLPAPVDPDRLQRIAARNGHILAFYVAPASGSTWQGWLASTGQAQIRKLGAGEDPHHPLGRLRDGSSFTKAEVHGPWCDCGTVWRDLGAALLPDELRGLVADSDPALPIRILIVPDGYLASIPWGALSIGGAPLVRRALLQVVPTVDLAGSSEVPPHRTGRPVLAYAPEIALRQLRGALTVRASSSRNDFVAALDDGAYAGAYIGTHGELTGLDQRVQLGESEWLSAAGALMHPWPDWVIFAACVVGQLDPHAGGEPLGLPISCMLGGSSSVIAAVVRIPGQDANEQRSITTDLFATVGQHLVEGMAAATALRTAQLAYLEANGELASVGDGLGAVCLSTQALTADGAHGR